MPRIGSASFGVHAATRADAAGIARVHVDTWRTTYRGLVRRSFLDSLSYEQRERQWRTALDRPDGGPIVIAREPGAPVVGFAAGGPERSGRRDYDGELYALYVLEPYQRHGLGSALLAAVVEGLRARGHDRLLAWVLNDNPAVGFYLGRGGLRVDERSVPVGGEVLREVAFGWSELAPLLRPPRAIGSRRAR